MPNSGTGQLQQQRGWATQDKLNAVARGLGGLMTHIADVHDRDSLRDDVAELRAAVGLEDSESA